MTGHQDTLPSVPDASPEEVAAALLDKHQVAAVDACADGVMQAETVGDDVALYHWLRVTREVVRKLIAQREELGG